MQVGAPTLQDRDSEVKLQEQLVDRYPPPTHVMTPNFEKRFSFALAHKSLAGSLHRLQLLSKPDLDSPLSVSDWCRLVLRLCKIDLRSEVA